MARGLPDLPPMRRVRAQVPTWGAIGVGRWAEVTHDASPTVVGVCAKCGETTPGRDLFWRLGQFGKDGYWGCRECGGGR